MIQSTNPDESPEIVPARPKAQVAAAVAILLAVGAGLAFALPFHVLPWIRRYLAGASRFEIAGHMQNVLFALAGLLVLGGVWATWHGVRLLRAGRWPLPGAFVMKETRVRRGAEARARAVTLIVLGVLQLGLAALAVALPRFIYQGIPAF